MLTTLKRFSGHVFFFLDRRSVVTITEGFLSRHIYLMSLALLFHYLMLNMFPMLIHPSSGACGLFVELFHGLYCSGSMCVGVTLWFGCDVLTSETC